MYIYHALFESECFGTCDLITLIFLRNVWFTLIFLRNVRFTLIFLRNVWLNHLNETPKAEILKLGWRWRANCNISMLMETVLNRYCLFRICVLERTVSMRRLFWAPKTNDKKNTVFTILLTKILFYLDLAMKYTGSMFNNL